MDLTRRYRRCWGLVLLVSLTGCQLWETAPDWQAYYEAKIGQPLTLVNEAAVHAAWREQSAEHQRVTRARLADGTTTFLGLPPRQQDPQHLVDATIPLPQDQWRQACQQAVGTEITLWNWSGRTDTITDYVDVYVSTRTPPDAVFAPDPAEPTCRFVFAGGGWYLELVHDHGKVAPIP